MNPYAYRVSTGKLDTGRVYVLVETPFARISLAQSVLRRDGDHIAVMHVACVMPHEQSIMFIHGGGC